MSLLVQKKSKRRARPRERPADGLKPAAKTIAIGTVRRKGVYNRDG